MRHYSLQFTIHTTGILLTGLALVACSPKVVLGEFDTDGTSSGTGDPATSSTSTGTGDPATSSTSTGTGDPATSSTSTGPGNTGPLHAACEVPAPEPLPPPPQVELVDGVPVFAEWQTLACDGADVIKESTCFVDGDCAGNNCVDFGSDQGVCSFFDIDIWCDGEGQVMGTMDGSCWICLPSSQHARACCADQDNFFDCRTWPFTDTPGGVGQVCAVHEDCEVGLVCSEPTPDNKPTGYGICACPGTDSDDIVPGGACF